MDPMPEHVRKASFENFASRGFSTLYLHTSKSGIVSSHIMSDLLRKALIVSLPNTQVNSCIDAILGMTAESIFQQVNVSYSQPGSTAQHLVTTSWLRSCGWLINFRLLVLVTVDGWSLLPPNTVIVISMGPRFYWGSIRDGPSLQYPPSTSIASGISKSSRQTHITPDCHLGGLLEGGIERNKILLMGIPSC